ncbi:MAG: phage gp6-like head-tail connector protein [Mycobacteriaceae bacterium]|nr:phage gp6-like head-tail connector protein [Mycobacteriaceae bacterium]
MSLLVSLSQMKARLRIDTSSADTDYTLLLNQAQSLVIDYVKQQYDDGQWATTVDAWTSSTVPNQVSAAILLMAGWLDAHRGDDDAKLTPGHLPAPVESCLWRLRDPGLA